MEFSARGVVSVLRKFQIFEHFRFQTFRLGKFCHSGTVCGAEACGVGRGGPVTCRVWCPRGLVSAGPAVLGQGCGVPRKDMSRMNSTDVLHQHLLDIFSRKETRKGREKASRMGQASPGVRAWMSGLSQPTPRPGQQLRGRVHRRTWGTGCPCMWPVLTPQLRKPGGREPGTHVAGLALLSGAGHLTGTLRCWLGDSMKSGWPWLLEGQALCSWGPGQVIAPSPRRPCPPHPAS